jgi:hypothetical protein
MWGSVVDRAPVEWVFSEYFGYPCHPFIPLIATKSSSSIIQGWYNRQINGHSKK